MPAPRAIRRLFTALNSHVGNLPSMPGIFPDYPAPIVRDAAGGREIVMARWGMPSSQRALMDATKKRAEKLQAKGKAVDFKELLRMEPDGGTTNIRNVSSAHWKRWLGPEHRCLVPFTSFSEYDTIDGKKVPVWFALDESRPLIAFAGLWTNPKGPAHSIRENSKTTTKPPSSTSSTKSAPARRSGPRSGRRARTSST